MGIIVGLLGGILAGLFLVVWRFILINDIRMRALRVIYEHVDWMEYAMAFDDGPDCHAMMLDWRKWTFKQFYPWLVRTK